MYVPNLYVLNSTMLKREIILQHQTKKIGRRAAYFLFKNSDRCSRKSTSARELIARCYQMS